MWKVEDKTISAPYECKKNNPQPLATGTTVKMINIHSLFNSSKSTKDHTLLVIKSDLVSRYDTCSYVFDPKVVYDVDIKVPCKEGVGITIIPLSSEGDAQVSSDETTVILNCPDSLNEGHTKATSAVIPTTENQDQATVYSLIWDMKREEFNGAAPKCELTTPEQNSSDADVRYVTLTKVANFDAQTTASEIEYEILVDSRVKSELFGCPIKMEKFSLVDMAYPIPCHQSIVLIVTDKTNQETRKLAIPCSNAGAHTSVLDFGKKDEDLYRSDKLQLYWSVTAGSGTWDGSLPDCEVRPVSLNVNEMEGSMLVLSKIITSSYLDEVSVTLLSDTSPIRQDNVFWQAPEHSLTEDNYVICQNEAMVTLLLKNGLKSTLIIDCEGNKDQDKTGLLHFKNGLVMEVEYMLKSNSIPAGTTVAQGGVTVTLDQDSLPRAPSDPAVVSDLPKYLVAPSQELLVTDNEYEIILKKREEEEEEEEKDTDEEDTTEPLIYPDDACDSDKAAAVKAYEFEKATLDVSMKIDDRIPTAAQFAFQFDVTMKDFDALNYQYRIEVNDQSAYLGVSLPTRSVSQTRFITYSSDVDGWKCDDFCQSSHFRALKCDVHILIDTCEDNKFKSAVYGFVYPVYSVQFPKLLIDVESAPSSMPFSETKPLCNQDQFNFVPVQKSAHDDIVVPGERVIVMVSVGTFSPGDSIKVDYVRFLRNDNHIVELGNQDYEIVRQREGSFGVEFSITPQVSFTFTMSGEVNSQARRRLDVDEKTFYAAIDFTVSTDPSINQPKVDIQDTGSTSDESEDHLGIIILVVALVLGVIIIAVIIFYFYRRQQKRNSMYPPVPGASSLDRRGQIQVASCEIIDAPERVADSTDQTVDDSDAFKRPDHNRALMKMKAIDVEDGLNKIDHQKILMKMQTSDKENP